MYTLTVRARSDVARIYAGEKAKFFFLAFIEKWHCLKVKINYQEISHFNYFILAGSTLTIFIIWPKITADAKLQSLRYYQRPL